MTHNALNQFREHCVTSMLRKLRLDAEFFRVLVALSGLGIDPWDGEWPLATR